MEHNHQTLFKMDAIADVFKTLENTLTSAHSCTRKPIKATPRLNELVTRFIEHHMQASMRIDHGQYAFKTKTYDPCIAKLSSLSKSPIHALQANTQHSGSYVLLRLMTPLEITSFTLAVAEDEAGQAIVVQIFNQNALPGNEPMEMLSIIAIKQPRVELVAWGIFGIRVDHPSDIRYVSKYDDGLPSHWESGDNLYIKSIQELKSEATHLYRTGHYPQAADCYSKAIEVEENESKILILKYNRAQCNYKMGKLDAVLLDLEDLSPDMKSYDEALYRKARALYDLRRFKESSDILTICCKLDPKSIHAQKLLADAIKRCVEEKTGRYPFMEMQLKLSEKNFCRMDYATYIGPVEVKPTPSQGRGLFTTQEVKVNDLLLCEKAMVYFSPEHDVSVGQQCPVWRVSETQAEAVPTSRNQLGQSAIRELCMIPSLIPKFTDLHRGSFQTETNQLEDGDGNPLVNSFLVHKIVKLNMLKCQSSTRQTYLQRDEQKISFLEDENDFQEDHKGPCGVWLMASRANHSCQFNAQHSFIGDMLILRATKNIPVDTEITIPYRERTNDDKVAVYENREFTCSCNICLSIKSTPPESLEERASLLDRARAFMASPYQSDIGELKNIIDELKETYIRSATSVPRPSIFEVKFALARIFDMGGLPINAAEVVVECFENLGYVISGARLSDDKPSTSPLFIERWGFLDWRLVKCWQILARSYRIKAPHLERAAKDYEKLFYKMCVGEDESFGADHY